MNKLRVLTKQPAAFLLLLLAVTFATYGFLLTRMGFYWDDWQAIYLHRLGNPGLFWSYFAYDRPVSAWTFMVTFPWLGSSPAAWQAFTIFLRWLTAAGFWWALRGLWPRHTAAVSWMALLLVVYPGFTQQPVSVAYSQHWLTYALFTFSLAWMVWSVRRPRLFWLFTLLSVLASLLQLLTMEYFAGLELLRPLVLWFLVKRQGQNWRERITRTVKLWWPYALSMAVFLVFRFVYYPRLSPDPGANTPVLLLNWLQSPITQTLHLLQIMAEDFLHLNLFAWINPINSTNLDLNAKFDLGSLAVGLLTGLLVALFLRAWMREDEPAAGSGTGNFTHQGIALGLLAVLLGGFPVWATDRQVIVGMWSDRFSLAPMFGVVILLVALLYWLVSGERRRAALLCLLAAISISAQMRTVYDYQRNWTQQQNFYWQLAWRIPALQPGTALLGTKMPFSLVADYSVAYAANIIYAPDAATTSAPYWFLSALRYQGGEIARFEDGAAIKYDLRTVRFDGKTEQALVIGRDSTGQCVRVYTRDDAFPPEITGDEVDLLNISHPEQIIINPNQPLTPPADIFGLEPEHTWCYYYEKADLARQAQDWGEVIRLYDQAHAAGYRTKYGFELLPFVEGYAHLGQWQQAYELTQAASQATASLEPRICHLWDQMAGATPDTPEKLSLRKQINHGYICK